MIQSQNNAITIMKPKINNRFFLKFKNYYIRTMYPIPVNPYIHDSIDTRANCKLCCELDEVSGTTAFDSTGNHNGTYSGNFVLNQTGKIGKAVQFGDTSKLQFVNHLDFTPNKAMSWVCWFYPTSYGAYSFLFQKASNSVNEVSCYTFGGTLRFSIGNGVNNSNFVQLIATLSVVGINLNQWNQVIVTWDGGASTTKHNGTNFIINGTLVSSSILTRSTPSGSYTGTTQSTQPFTIYSSQYSVNQMLGLNDQFRVYHEDLSKNLPKAQALWNGGLGIIY